MLPERVDDMQRYGQWNCPAMECCVDNELVASWINGSAAVSKENAIVIAACQRLLFASWKESRAIPASPGSLGWIRHHFREHNAEADSAADIAAASREVFCSPDWPPPSKPIAIRSMSDGTAGKSNTSPAAGIVLFAFLGENHGWVTLCTLSYPLLFGTSSVKSELIACQIAISVCRFLSPTSIPPQHSPSSELCLLFGLILPAFPSPPSEY